MFDNFDKHLRDHIAFLDDDLERIHTGSVKRTLRKWEPLLRTGRYGVAWKIPVRTCWLILLRHHLRSI